MVANSMSENSVEVNSSLPAEVAPVQDLQYLPVQKLERIQSAKTGCSVPETQDKRNILVSSLVKRKKGVGISTHSNAQHKINQQDPIIKNAISRKSALDKKVRGASKNRVTDLKHRAKKVMIQKVELAFDAISSERCREDSVAKHLCQSREILNLPLRNYAVKIDEEINREEEAHEFEKCVSLLTKYGVIPGDINYCSQRLPSSIPHPGFVGDGLLSKTCKICQVLEDEKSTVICDECQEAFHMSCCTPRLTLKYFTKEDDWYCSNCRKQKKKISSKISSDGIQSQGGTGSKSKIYQNKMFDDSGKSFLLDKHHVSKVRLGPAHQVDVPPWTGIVEEKLDAGCHGTEVPLSKEEKMVEKERIMKEYHDKLQSLGWTPAKLLPEGSPQNWLQCHCVMQRGIKDRNGQKITNEIICGKWRRAPLGVEQKEVWECFCTMFWDPSHADCAIPQELPTEEVIKRMQ